ncbi:hypothetical protein C1H46_041317 [Malus baccata]|uniref:Uncharacterized protein n=1 Tax=Malus baccata TaxID=106549 RepID=A0A540KG48_MALBA|nr:hypothetical protein C1H46_041317 [Malus baccata]
MDNSTEDFHREPASKMEAAKGETMRCRLFLAGREDLVVDLAMEALTMVLFEDFESAPPMGLGFDGEEGGSNQTVKVMKPVASFSR